MSGKTDFRHTKDWSKFETNNKLIGLNILFIPYKKKEIRQAFISKQFKASKLGNSLNDHKSMTKCKTTLFLKTTFF